MHQIALTGSAATWVRTDQPPTQTIHAGELDGSGPLDLDGLVARFDGSSLAAVLVPPVMEARITDEEPTSRPIPVLAQDSRASGTLMATGSGVGGLRYIAECIPSFVESLIDACEKTGSELRSITSADSAWAAAGTVLAKADVCLLTVQLSEAGQLRLIVVREGKPVFLRRLPLTHDLEGVSTALESMAHYASSVEVPFPVVALGDEANRARIAQATRVAGWPDPIQHERLEELNYDPLAVAAVFGGAGPRFVPPEVVSGARRVTRRRGLISLALAVALVCLAAFLDLADLQSELDAVRAARKAIDEPVAEAMAARSELAASATMVATLEELRLATPRWTAMLAALADATPPTAHLRAVRTVRDSVYVDVEGQDVAAAIEGLRRVPWWQGIRTVSPVETEVTESGVVSERATIAGEVDWEPLNFTEGQSP